MKLASIVTIFLVLSIFSFAMDLAEMLGAAVENDPKVKVLTVTLEKTLLGIERARLAPGLNFELSTGDIQTSYSFNPRNGDPEWLISLKPSAALILGRKSETEISAELPVGIGLGSTQEFAVLPSVAIRQPLDKLFNGEKFTDEQEIQNRYAAEKSRIDIVKRVKEVEQDLIRRLSTITAMEQQAAGLERKLAVAREAWQEALTLETYAAGSAQERKLGFSVRQLERQVELQQRKVDLARKELERIVGTSVATLPDGFPEVALELPDPASASKNPDVFLAALAVEVAKARLEEEREPAEPKFFIGSALRSTLDTDSEETTTTFAGTVDGELEDFKFTTGVGGIFETGTVFVTVGFSWSFPDKQIESMNLKEREKLVDISRLNLSRARNIFFRTMELLELEVAELAYRRSNIEEQRTLAELELEEGLQSSQLGLMTEHELNDLRWEVETLNYTARILQLDQLLNASRLDALVALETETE